MTTTQPQYAVATSRLRRRRRAHQLPRTTGLLRGTRSENDSQRRDTRRAHSALLVALISLAIATVVYAIVREAAAALILIPLIALQARIAATAAIHPCTCERRQIRFTP
jgi:hypothetical protein